VTDRLRRYESALVDIRESGCFLFRGEHAVVSLTNCDASRDALDYVLQRVRAEIATSESIARGECVSCGYTPCMCDQQ